MGERYYSVFMLKPDAFREKVSVKILNDLMKAGFLWETGTQKHITLSLEQAQLFYPFNEDWMENIGKKTKALYLQRGLSLSDIFGSEDAKVIGAVVASWVWKYIRKGSIIGIKIYNQASSLSVIEELKEFVGATNPAEASPNSIRGKYGTDSIEEANLRQGACENLAHRSDSWEAAQRESAVLVLE